jgi:hypothetical protein
MLVIRGVDQMWKVHVLPGKTHVQEGLARATQKPYRIETQAAAIEFPSGEVQSFNLRVKEGEKPFAPGVYALAPESLYVMEGALAVTPRLASVGGGTK